MRLFDFADLGDGRGFGRVVAQEGGSLTLEYTAIPGIPPVESALIAKKLVKRWRLWEGEEGYLRAGEAWQRCRVVGPVGDFYRVEMRGHTLEVAPADLTVIWAGQWDPLAFVESGATSGANITAGRVAAAKEFAQQRALSKNLAGVLSSSVHLYRHQLAVTLRVLRDPVRRFILADEVGLGKTIEAGLICREISLSEPGTSFTFIVPDVLQEQWREELKWKFGFTTSEQRDGAWVNLLPHSAVDSDATPGQVMIVDEAHRLVEDDEQFFQVADLATRSRDLLLLSATPLRSDRKVLFRLLHLTDPNAYPLSRFDEFSLDFDQRRAEAFRISALTASVPRFIWAEDIAHFVTLHPEDEQLSRLADTALAGSDQEAATHIRELKEHLADTYRLSRRLIRTRRSSTSMPVAGRRVRFVDFDSGTLGSLTDEVIDEVLNGLRASPELSDTEIKSHVNALLAAASAGRTALESVVRQTLETEERTGSVDDLRRRTLAGLARELADFEGPDHESLLLGEVRSVIRSGKTVVASTSTERAKSLTEALRHDLGSLMVASHLDDGNPLDSQRAVLRFTDSPNCNVLVIDGSGEEGLNLQRARTLINADFSLAVNRMEQRIGRLDRYSLDGEAEIVIFRDQGSRWMSALADFLDEGVGIFSESIATAQQALSAIETDTCLLLVEKGRVAIERDLESLRGRITSEAARVEELEDVESSDLDSGFKSSEFQQLIEAEEESQRIAAAIDEVTHAGRGINLTKRLVPENALLFNYSAHNISVREDFAPKFAAASEGTRTFSRSKALFGKAKIARIGDPLIDLLEWFVEQDHDGRAFGLWRQLQPGLADPMPFAMIEWRMGFGGPRHAHPRVHQIGNSLQPPKFERSWIGLDGVVPNQFVQRYLDPTPFRTTAETPFRDAGIEGRHWESVWEEVPTIASLRSLARRTVDLTAERLRKRCRDEGLEALDLARHKRLQKTTHQHDKDWGLIVDGISNPDVRIFAAGVLILSSEPLPQFEVAQ